MVERLANAVGVDPAAIWSDKPLESSPTLAFLRGLWKDFHPDDLDAFDEALERGASLRAALRCVGADVGWSAFTAEPARGAPYEHGYELARKVRRWLEQESEPLGDLHDLLGLRFGVPVVQATLRTARLWAATIGTEEARAVIARAGQPPILLRRTLAHELCHVLFDDVSGGTIVEIDTDDSNDRNEPIERRARAFAAEFLVPRDGLIRKLGVPQHTVDFVNAQHLVAEAARAFGAPWELVVNHLVNHKWIAQSEPLRRRLIEDGRSPDEVDWPATSQTDWLKVRVGEALEQDAITEGRAHELSRDLAE